jgi:hypothetical protein
MASTAAALALSKPMRCSRSRSHSARRAATAAVCAARFSAAAADAAAAFFAAASRSRAASSCRTSTCGGRVSGFVVTRQGLAAARQEDEA